MRVTICPLTILLKEMKSIFSHSLQELTFVSIKIVFKLFLSKKTESSCLTVTQFEGDSIKEIE